MRLSLVVIIFTAVMIAPVVPTDFFISGTVSCQSIPPWCYTIQLLELDSISNDVFGSVSKCELTNSTQKFLFFNWHPADGLFDWHYELELLIKHDCGLEVTDEKQSMRMSFGQYHSNKSHVNYSIDPCTDFYAHACPTSFQGSFFQMLSSKRDVMVDQYKKKNDKFKRFNVETLVNIDSIITKLRNHRLDGYRMDIGEIDLSNFRRMSGDQKQKLFEQVIDGNNQYAQLKTELNQAANALAASIIFDRLDKNARSFFGKLKNYVMKVIETTPWAKTYQSTEKFQEALENIELFTFRDARLAVELAMDKYNRLFYSCQSTVHGSFSSEQAETFCEIFATRHTKTVLDIRNEKVFDFGRYTVLEDKGSMLNHNDKAVYFSNDFLLLMSTTHLSDKFGAAGFVFLHEIMHTLVMGPNDFFNPLIPFWTTKSDCVAEQAMKTCTTFPIMGCNPNATFEEDAADMAAYRIAWDFYRKSYTRKTVVQNYESLTKDQLFFYGASVLLCDSRSMMAMQTNEVDPHTNNYQRVNTLMSQMPAFGDAFQCKPTDKMMENKARHCELYGNNAPAVKKRKFSSKG